jgi:flavin reductase (DIM6/NTAB) family NADH-FMN oxidoreductase RutF
MAETLWPQVEAQAFKEVMARWSSGVTIVTTRQAATPVGMTVSSFTSVSLEPPQILICANHRAHTHHAIVESGFFAVNFLAVDQVEWGKRFAGQVPAGEDRFAGIAWTTAPSSAPILPGVLGWLDCRVSQRVISGDHTIFIGAVIACDLYEGKPPLLYHHRAWRRLAEE